MLITSSSVTPYISLIRLISALTSSSVASMFSFLLISSSKYLTLILYSASGVICFLKSSILVFRYARYCSKDNPCIWRRFLYSSTIRLSSASVISGLISTSKVSTAFLSNSSMYLFSASAFLCSKRCFLISSFSSSSVLTFS